MPLGERGLPRTERPDQDDEVARARSTSASAAPSACGVLRRSAARARPSRVLPSVPATAVRSASSPARGRAVRAEPDGRRRVVGRPDGPPVHVVRPAADLAPSTVRGPEEPLRRRQPQRDDDGRVEQLELAAQPAAAAGHLRGLRRPVARRPALHDVEHGGLARGPARPRRAAGRAARRTSRRTAGRSRPRWRRAPRRPARTADGRTRARRRRRRAAGSRPARGRRRSRGPRRPATSQSGAAAAMRATSSADASRRGGRGAATRAP